MNRASPVQLRKALEAANTLAKAGVLFVAIPVMSEQDHGDLLFKLQSRLEKMEAEIAAAEAQT